MFPPDPTPEAIADPGPTGEAFLALISDGANVPTITHHSMESTRLLTPFGQKRVRFVYTRGHAFGGRLHFERVAPVT